MFASAVRWQVASRQEDFLLARAKAKEGLRDGTDRPSGSVFRPSIPERHRALTRRSRRLLALAACLLAARPVPPSSARFSRPRTFPGPCCSIRTDSSSSFPRRDTDHPAFPARIDPHVSCDSTLRRRASAERNGHHLYRAGGRRRRTARFQCRCQSPGRCRSRDLGLVAVDTPQQNYVVEYLPTLEPISR